MTKLMFSMHFMHVRKIMNRSNNNVIILNMFLKIPFVKWTQSETYEKKIRKKNRTYQLISLQSTPISMILLLQ